MRPSLPSLAAATLLAAGLAAAADEDRPGVVVTGRNAHGQVWVNLSLTSLRLEEPYVPMVVAVYNHGKGQATVTRSSFRLVGSDGRSTAVPGVRELRRGYTKLTVDQRMANAIGIPVGTQIRRERLVRSSFFPPMSPSRTAITFDRVTMPRFYAMVDLLYFERPKGLALGHPVVLVVNPTGWEEPIRLRVQVRP